MSDEPKNKDVYMLQQRSEQLLQKGDYAALSDLVERLKILKDANTPMQDENTPMQDANTSMHEDAKGGRNKRGKKSKKYSKTKSKSRTRRGGRRSRRVRRIKCKSRR